MITNLNNNIYSYVDWTKKEIICGKDVVSVVSAATSWYSAITFLINKRILKEENALYYSLIEAFDSCGVKSRSCKAPALKREYAEKQRIIAEQIITMFMNTSKDFLFNKGVLYSDENDYKEHWENKFNLMNFWRSKDNKLNIDEFKIKSVD